MAQRELDGGVQGAAGSGDSRGDYRQAAERGGFVPTRPIRTRCPPYEVLDDVLRGLVEEERSTEEIVARGHAAETAARIWRMLDIAEYKRRQAPPGIKLTLRSFGKDRRYPITNRYRGTG